MNIRIRNTGAAAERAESYIEREETTTEAAAIDVEAGVHRTVSAEMKRGTVVVSKGDLGHESTLDGCTRRNPTLQIDIGRDVLGLAGECFDIELQ